MSWNYEVLIFFVIMSSLNNVPSMIRGNITQAILASGNAERNGEIFLNWQCIIKCNEFISSSFTFQFQCGIECSFSFYVNVAEKWQALHHAKSVKVGWYIFSVMFLSLPVCNNLTDLLLFIRKLSDTLPTSNILIHAGQEQISWYFWKTVSFWSFFISLGLCLLRNEWKYFFENLCIYI